MRVLVLLFILTTSLFAQNVPHTLTIDGHFLTALKRTHNHAVLQRVRTAANREMHVGPFSVMENKMIPPSGDRHDYMSMGIYWWPNPATRSGLPYVRHDGRIDPQAANIPDHSKLFKLQDAVQTLGIAYYLTGNEAYAARSAMLLRTWFLNPSTRMNPNLNDAQAVPGRNNGRGEGVLDARYMPKILDGIALIRSSPALTARDRKGLHRWFAEYLKWLQVSKNGRQESHAKNNHGNWYNEQFVGIALYLGDKGLARKRAEMAETLIAQQIMTDGRQPLELARTKSFSYSEFNLEALSRLALEAGSIGIDLWGFHAKGGASMQSALNYLLPYATDKRIWPYKAINGEPTNNLVQPLLLAASHFHDRKYLTLAEKLNDHPTLIELLLEKQAEAELRRKSA
jgi:hypothetical protein